MGWCDTKSFFVVTLRTFVAQAGTIHWQVLPVISRDILSLFLSGSNSQCVAGVCELWHQIYLRHKPSAREARKYRQELFSREYSLLHSPYVSALSLVEEVNLCTEASIWGHPAEVFVSRPMTGVVRMSISVIKILTEGDLSTGRLEGVKFRFLHIHDLRL